MNKITTKLRKWDGKTGKWEPKEVSPEEFYTQCLEKFVDDNDGALEKIEKRLAILTKLVSIITIRMFKNDQLTTEEFFDFIPYSMQEDIEIKVKNEQK